MTQKLQSQKANYASSRASHVKVISTIMYYMIYKSLHLKIQIEQEYQNFDNWDAELSNEQLAHSTPERELQSAPSLAVVWTRHMSQTKPNYEKYSNLILIQQNNNSYGKFVNFWLDLQLVSWKFMS